MPLKNVLLNCTALSMPCIKQNPMMKNDQEAFFPIMKTISSAGLTNYTWYLFFGSLFMFFIFPWVKCAFAIPISHYGTFTNPSFVCVSLVRVVFRLLASKTDKNHLPRARHCDLRHFLGRATGRTSTKHLAHQPSRIGQTLYPLDRS